MSIRTDLAADDRTGTPVRSKTPAGTLGVEGRRSASGDGATVSQGNTIFSTLAALTDPYVCVSTPTCGACKWGRVAPSGPATTRPRLAASPHRPGPCVAVSSAAGPTARRNKHSASSASRVGRRGERWRKPIGLPFLFLFPPPQPVAMVPVSGILSLGTCVSSFQLSFQAGLFMTSPLSLGLPLALSPGRLVALRHHVVFGLCEPPP